MYNVKFKDLIKPNAKPNKAWIYMDTNPVIRAVAKPIDSYEFSNEDIYYLKRMVNYIEASFFNKAKKFKIRAGVAIAAPQVGWSKRATYIHFENDDKVYQYLLINPEIVYKSEQIAYIICGEGCLSVEPDKAGNVPRHSVVRVKAYDLIREKEIEEEFSGFAAMCLQHELDHLDGKVYYDHINKDDPQYSDKAWIKIGR
ncbi:peptide deformylase [Ureaplasma diversum]|uniref:Peptide deformylase n=1 Tax=Ureaplasma diversum NCTC 246 TaxID=1188241 RepID=A0A084F1G0_9BACT|nr:peptide deformylase [Ureaplasma diversum]KEZ24052.1 Peptide deformylase 2 [Ureaplasma diversum NCTC 246]